MFLISCCMKGKMSTVLPGFLAMLCRFLTKRGYCCKLVLWNCKFAEKLVPHSWNNIFFSSHPWWQKKIVCWSLLPVLCILSLGWNQNVLEVKHGKISVLHCISSTRGLACRVILLSFPQVCEIILHIRNNFPLS